MKRQVWFVLLMLLCILLMLPHEKVHGYSVSNQVGPSLYIGIDDGKDRMDFRANETLEFHVMITAVPYSVLIRQLDLTLTLTKYYRTYGGWTFEETIAENGTQLQAPNYQDKVFNFTCPYTGILFLEINVNYEYYETVLINGSMQRQANTYSSNWRLGNILGIVTDVTDPYDQWKWQVDHLNIQVDTLSKTLQNYVILTSFLALTTVSFMAGTLIYRSKMKKRDRQNLEPD